MPESRASECVADLQRAQSQSHRFAGRAWSAMRPWARRQGALHTAQDGGGGRRIGRIESRTISSRRTRSFARPLLGPPSGEFETLPKIMRSRRTSRPVCSPVLSSGGNDLPVPSFILHMSIFAQVNDKPWNYGIAKQAVLSGSDALTFAHATHEDRFVTRWNIMIVIRNGGPEQRRSARFGKVSGARV